MTASASTGSRAVLGTRLHYELSGAGTPLVLVHGFGLDHRLWDPQLPALRPHHRVLRYDERGFGLSDDPSDEAYSHADDLDALMAELALEAAHVVALSIGAMHALELALWHPARVRSLVLVDASGLGSVEFPSDIQQVFAAIRAVMNGPAPAQPDVDDARSARLHAAKRIWRTAGWFAPALEQPACARALDAQLARYRGFHWSAPNPMRRPSPPIHARLGDISVPTLVMVGERDLAYNHRVAALLRDGIAGAQLHVIGGAGHLPNLEAPAAFNAALCEFVARVEA